jgi:hypothetical protein
MMWRMMWGWESPLPAALAIHAMRTQRRMRKMKPPPYMMSELE